MGGGEVMRTRRQEQVTGDWSGVSGNHLGERVVPVSMEIHDSPLRIFAHFSKFWKLG